MMLIKKRERRRRGKKEQLSSAKQQLIPYSHANREKYVSTKKTFVHHTSSQVWDNTTYKT
jgi:hypothetical protein